MASRRSTSVANGLLTAYVIGRIPLRRRVRGALLRRSRKLVMVSFAWRVVRRIMVGKPAPVRIVKTRSATVETE